MRFRPLARCVRSVTACAVLVAFSAAPIEAQTDRILADVTFNGQAEGRSLIVVQDGDVLAEREALLRLGVTVAPAECETAFDDTFVSLSRLHSRLSYTFDEPTFTLKLVSAVNALPHKTIAIIQPTEAQQSDFAKSLVLTYGLHGSLGSPLSGALTQRLNLKPNAVFENTFGKTAAGLITRGITSLTMDVPEQTRRTVIGDSTLSAGILGTGMEIGGVSVSRDFSLEPYQPTFPMPAMQTIVTSPSLADVYVNGMLVKTLNLAPGNYNLSDLPVQSGYSDARVVLRNEFGTQATDIVEYGAPSLLRKGLTDYQYGIGFVRNDDAGRIRYGSPATSLKYRIGVSPFSTAGASLQAMPGQFTGGLSYAGIMRFGYVEADASASDVDGEKGASFAFGYSTNGPHNAGSVQARFASPTYRNVGSARDYESLLSDYTVTLARHLDTATTASISARYAQYRQSGTLHYATLSITHRLKDWNASASLVAAAAAGKIATRTNDFTITLTRALGESTTQSISTGEKPGDSSTTIAHSADSAMSASYSATLSPARDRTASGNAHFGLPFASANVAANAGESGLAGVNVDFNGSLVVAQGQALLSQPIDDAFALVHADGAPNASVYLNGHFAARTNAAGYAVVPFLGSNETSRIQLSGDGLALENIVGNSDRAVFPAFHAGTAVDFAVHRVHAVTGTLRVRHAGKIRIPAYGQFDVPQTQATVSSPIDESGRFYLDGLTAGTFEATVEDQDGSCVMHVNVPAFTTATFDMGTVECAY